MATYRSYDSATITGTLPANDEPRHTDEDGKSVVGAVDLRGNIDATSTLALPTRLGVRMRKHARSVTVFLATTRTSTRRTQTSKP